MSKAQLEQAGARLAQALERIESALEGDISHAADAEKIGDLEARLKAVTEERDALVTEMAGLKQRHNDLAQAFEALRAERESDPSDKLPNVEDLRAAYDELERAYTDLQNEMLTKGPGQAQLDEVRLVHTQVEARLDGVIARLERMAG